MKLNEIKSIDSLTEIFAGLESQLILEAELTESATTGLLHLYNSLKEIFSTLGTKAGGKNSLNDSTLLGIYKTELDLLRPVITGLPVKVQEKLKPLLNAAGIKLSGVDVSRKHLHRIVVAKLLRYVFAILKNTLQNPVEAVLDALVLGLGKIVSAIMNAKDTKGIVVEISRTFSQLKDVVKKAQAGG
jgi:hypothetical protein